MHFCVRPPPPPKKKNKVSGFWSLSTSPQTSASAFLVLFFFAMKRCPIAAKIAGLCFKRLVHRLVCPICEAFLSHHSLCIGNLVWYQ